MADNMSSCDYAISNQKIKVTSLDIIVNGTASKPYYEIKYTTLDGVTHIGYSSYKLENVFQWQHECFELVDINTTDIVQAVQVLKSGSCSKCVHTCNSTLDCKYAGDVCKLKQAVATVVEYFEKQYSNR